jgi:hypothetical protein
MTSLGSFDTAIQVREKIFNPTTKRMVYADGVIGKRLQKADIDGLAKTIVMPSRQFDPLAKTVLAKTIIAPPSYMPARFERFLNRNPDQNIENRSSPLLTELEELFA